MLFLGNRHNYLTQKLRFAIIIGKYYIFISCAKNKLKLSHVHQNLCPSNSMLNREG